MSRTFKITREPFEKGNRLYEKKEITINPGVTVLVGCNGSGKTTLLHQIELILKREKIPCFTYDNLHDGGSHAKDRAMFQNDISLVAQLIMSSEGEQIYRNIGEAATRIGRFVNSNRDKEEIWILFDAIDSGLSIDNIIEIKRDLFETILDDSGTKNTYIVVSANSFEMCAKANCFDVTKGEYIEIPSYTAYRAFITNSRKLKDKRFA